MIARYSLKIVGTSTFYFTFHHLRTLAKSFPFNVFSFNSLWYDNPSTPDLMRMPKLKTKENYFLGKV